VGVNSSCIRRRARPLADGREVSGAAAAAAAAAAVEGRSMRNNWSQQSSLATATRDLKESKVREEPGACKEKGGRGGTRRMILR
jgi:hypothetical protein